jgi:hypothetical protein
MCITARSQEGLECLKQLVEGQGRQDISAAAYTRIADLWKDIDQKYRIDLLSHILRITRSVSSDENALTAKHQADASIRTLPLLSDDLVHLIESLPGNSNLTGEPASKKRRLSGQKALEYDVSTQDAMDILQQYTLVLEVVEHSKPADSPELLKSLFHVLAELRKFAAQTDTSLGYLKGLAINSLLHMAEKLKVSTTPVKNDRN